MKTLVIARMAAEQRQHLACRAKLSKVGVMQSVRVYVRF